MIAMTIRRRHLAAVLAAGLLLTGCGQGGEGTTADPAATTPAASPATTAAVTTSPEPTTPATESPTVTAPPTSAGPEHDQQDVSFASMMVPHHQQALEMSDIVLGKQGVDPQVTQLAQQIRSAQAPEIDAMNSWLQGWGVTPPPMDHSGHMDGMLDEKQMDALRQADGPEAGRLFLEGMIEHHQGAADMARAELEKGQNPQAKALAEQIIASQEAEIAQMRSMLGQ